jgi:hypothetical protein
MFQRWRKGAHSMLKTLVKNMDSSHGEDECLPSLSLRSDNQRLGGGEGWAWSAPIWTTTFDLTNLIWHLKPFDRGPWWPWETVLWDAKLHWPLILNLPFATSSYCIGDDHEAKEVWLNTPTRLGLKVTSIPLPRMCVAEYSTYMTYIDHDIDPEWWQCPMDDLHDACLQAMHCSMHETVLWCCIVQILYYDVA